MSDPDSESRIFVTGGNGFVCRHLVPVLARAIPRAQITVGVYQGVAPQFPSTVRQVLLDVTDAGQVHSVLAAEQPTHLMHLAAIASVQAAQDDIRRTWAVNHGGMLNVALAVLEIVPSCCVLYCSSSEIYGESFRSGQPLGEGAAIDPNNAYAASKAAADIMIGQMAKQGLHAVRLRPFNHIGPGQSESFVVPSFAAQIARIERGEQEPVIRVGNLASRRDFLDVRDVVDAYIQSILRFDELPSGCAINIASGKALAIGEILDVLLARSSRKIEIQQDEKRLRAFDIPLALGDASLAHRLLGWKPSREVTSALADILDFFRRA